MRRADRLPLAGDGGARRSAWASTASAPRRTSWRRWRAIAASRCTPSPGRATRRRRFLRAISARSGSAASDQRPPEPLDAAIIFAPVGALVPAALAAVGKGGVVVAGGIHMSDIPSFPYSILWGERVVRSVANLTRRDAEDFLRARAAGAGADRGPHLPARAGQRGAGMPARGPAAGCCGATAGLTERALRARRRRRYRDRRRHPPSTSRAAPDRPRAEIAERRRWHRTRRPCAFARAPAGFSVGAVSHRPAKGTPVSVATCSMRARSPSSR